MKDRVALVTGGTGGIGTEICRALAAAGAKVVATHYSGDEAAEEAKLAEKGITARVMVCDVSDFDAVGALVARVENEVGPVDILVNAAGITRDATLKKMGKDKWDAVLRANLDSVFNTCRQVIGGMLERGYGRIVNISSINGQKGQFGQANYAASKAGMHGLTMSLAQEVARKGITVNTVSPGYIATEMVMAVPEEIRNQIIAQIPVGRLGKPEEIARIVAFLADEDSAFVTGANLDINGGQWMH
jgi:acetoacetyl-CoA reductase